MSRRNVIIDRLNIHLPSGWKGDPVLLARQIGEQLQSQAQHMKNADQLNIKLQGNYAGNYKLVTPQLSKKLRSEMTQDAKDHSSLNQDKLNTYRSSKEGR